MIDFAQPGYLLLLLVVLAMAGAGLWLVRWRDRARQSFAGPQAAHWPTSAFWPRLLLVLLAAGLIVVAAARPRWGHSDRVRERQGVDLVIALDVSQSMQAADVAPNRLRAAQDEVVSLVEAERGSRIGLVLFAGSSILRSPLTTDTLAMSQLVRRADRDAGLTRSGSDLGAALFQAERILSAGEKTSGKAVLIVSDGEDHAGEFIDQARSLREKGIAVFTAGVGTPQGAPLFDVDPRNGQQRPKLDAQGRAVISRLDEGKLRSIASEGGGRYVHLGGEGSLVALRDDLARFDQTVIGEERQQLPIERFQAFIVAALLLLAESWLLPSRLLVPSARSLRRLRPHAGLTVMLLALVIGACGGNALREKNAAANRLYNAGDYNGALKAYQELVAQRPDVPEVSLNASNTLHRLGNYERAVAEAQRALPPDKVGLGAATYYSLGNHLFALGRLEQAYEAYKSGLLLNPKDADAKHNLELTLLQLTASQNSQPGPNPGGQAPGQQQPDGQQPPRESTDAAQPQQPSGAPSNAPSGDPRRELQEALRGLDQDVSFEEALRILDLLREQQERQRPQVPGSNRGLGPDY